MVCQAASQTRFRALKHENGTAGDSTIIVRVIACFHPLRECQVCIRKKANLRDVVFLGYVFFHLFYMDVQEARHCLLIHIFHLAVFQAEYFRHLLKPVT